MQSKIRESALCYRPVPKRLTCVSRIIACVCLSCMVSGCATNNADASVRRNERLIQQGATALLTRCCEALPADATPAHTLEARLEINRAVVKAAGVAMALQSSLHTTARELQMELDAWQQQRLSEARMTSHEADKLIKRSTSASSVQLGSPESIMPHDDVNMNGVPDVIDSELHAITNKVQLGRSR